MNIHIFGAGFGLGMVVGAGPSNPIGLISGAVLAVLTVAFIVVEASPTKGN